MKLFDYINTRVQIKSQYRDEIEKAFVSKTYKKGDIVLEPKNKSQKVIFIESGFLRMFYYMDEKTISFLFLDENTLMLPLESIHCNILDTYGWEVLHDCELQVTQYSNLEKLMDSVPNFERFVLYKSFDVLKQLSDKFNSTLHLNAEERYNHLLEMYPNITQNVSLGYIASFLGISQQHLSVIRSKKS